MRVQLPKLRRTILRTVARFLRDRVGQQATCPPSRPLQPERRCKPRPAGRRRMRRSLLCEVPPDDGFPTVKIYALAEKGFVNRPATG